MDAIVGLMNGLHGLSVALGLGIGLVGGFVFAMLTYRFYGRNFRHTFERISDEMKLSFKSLSSEVLTSSQQDFLSLADRELDKKTEQHTTELESKKELIDTQLQQMSETLKTVPTELEKNQKNVTEVLDKSAEQLEKSNKSYMDQLTQKTETQTKEHFTKLEDKEVQINRTLGEMKDKLGKVEELIQEFEKARESKLGALDDQLKNLTQTTSSLQTALADNQARGQWGERIAEDILRLLGFVEGVNYFRQLQTPSGERPDFTIKLPNELSVNMDVKYSFDNYDLYHKAESESDRKKFVAAFLRNVKNEVKSVSSRDYINEQTVNCVLLFVPNERIYRFIHEQDHLIIDTALRSKVVLCSPLILYPVLAVIHQAAQNLAFERKSQEVFAVLSEIRTEWEKYTDLMEGMEKNFATIQDKFHKLTVTRTRALDRKFNKIDGLLDSHELKSANEMERPQLPEETT